MGPQFKPVTAEEIVLNKEDWFWVEIEATHISFKNGIGTSWTGSNGDHRSTNNRRFIGKKGNCYHLPEFKFTASGYQYEPVMWEWRCRQCFARVSVQLLDPREVCFRCNMSRQKTEPNFKS